MQSILLRTYFATGYFFCLIREDVQEKLIMVITSLPCHKIIVASLDSSVFLMRVSLYQEVEDFSAR
jgi:hypothetical protein